MRVFVQRESSPIKSGWAARSPRLRLAGHGRTPQIADANLERVIGQFLAPFERNDTLTQEVSGLGLQTDDDTSPGITVHLHDAESGGADWQVADRALTRMQEVE